jgi:death-on-curing protein
MAMINQTLKFGPVEAIEFMLSVAAGKLTSQQVADWLRQRLS